MNQIIQWAGTLILWAWGGFCAVLLILVILILAIIMPLGSYEGILMHGCRVMLRLIGIRVTTEGEDNFDPEQTYVYMANHVNIFDTFVLGGYIPGLKRGVEAAEHFSWPLWGWLVKRMGNIPIQRFNLTEAKKSLNTAAEAVNQGISIVILPEGHRTRDGLLGEFKKGPFHMAKAAGVPVIPMGMNGMLQVKRYKNPHWRPGPVHIKYGKPIPLDVVEESSVEELRDITRNAVGELIDYEKAPEDT